MGHLCTVTKTTQTHAGPRTRADTFNTRRHTRANINTHKHKPQYQAVSYMHITLESQNAAKAQHKTIRENSSICVGFYNEISPHSLCKLSVTVSKSVQPLLMNCADNSRQIKPGIHSHSTAPDAT